MHDLVRVVFRRLEDLDPSVEEKAASEDEPGTATLTELRMTVSPTQEASAQTLDQVVESDVPQRERTPIQSVSDGISFMDFPFPS